MGVEHLVNPLVGEESLRSKDLDRNVLLSLLCERDAEGQGGKKGSHSASPQSGTSAGGTRKKDPLSAWQKSTSDLPDLKPEGAQFRGQSRAAMALVDGWCVDSWVTLHPVEDVELDPGDALTRVVGRTVGQGTKKLLDT